MPYFISTEDGRIGDDNSFEPPGLGPWERALGLGLVRIKDVQLKI